jgi:hypothetical protein
MDRDLIDYALHEQQKFHQNDVNDGYIGGDKRTREERKAAADRIVEMLRSYQTQENDYALSEAAAYGNCDEILALLNTGVNPNVKDWYHRTPLYEAVTAFQDEAVQILLQHGADPRIPTRCLEPVENSIERILEAQKTYRKHPGTDLCMGGDKRTREERKAAIDRIVEMLKPYQVQE